MIETLENRQMMTATGISELSVTDAALATPDLVVYKEAPSGGVLKLMGEILSNVSKTRSEISMTFARNARA